MDIIYDRSVTIIIITSIFTIKYIGTHTHYIIIYKYTARATAALCMIIIYIIYIGIHAFNVRMKL